MTRETKIDIVLVAGSILISISGLVSVYFPCAPLAWFAVLAADIYLLFALLAVAHTCDKSDPVLSDWMKRILPRRLAGMFLVAFLLLAHVSGFAGFYVRPGMFQQTKSPLDALYVSFSTIGFNDFQPTADGERFVMFQLASAVLLMIAAFPLLISRISGFKS
jgi:hypothetical protein